MAHDVFISYSSKDKPVADAVCAGLEARGLRCWVAPRDILPGADWGGAIIDAITGSKVMVLIFSSHANASPQIKREVERAVAKGVRLVPFRIEDVALGKTLEYFISTPHWLDALTQPLDAHIGKLAETVRLLAAARDSTEVPPPLHKPTGARLAAVEPPAPVPAAPARSPSRAPLLVGLLAAAAAAAYFLLLRPEPPEIVAVNFPASIPAGGRDVVGTVQFKAGRDAIARAEFSVVQAARFDGFSFAPNVTGQKRGSFSFGIHAGTAQQVTLAATLVDASGRRSSPVSFSFEVKKAAAPAPAPAPDHSIQINAPHGLKFKIPR